MSLPVGTRPGPCEVAAPLGAAGRAEVDRARDRCPDRHVAARVLPQHLPVSLARSIHEPARFGRGAMTVTSLNHPRICAPLDVGREGGTECLVMALVEGETLEARLARPATCSRRAR